MVRYAIVPVLRFYYLVYITHGKHTAKCTNISNNDRKSFYKNFRKL